MASGFIFCKHQKFAEDIVQDQDNHLGNHLCSHIPDAEVICEQPDASHLDHHRCAPGTDEFQEGRNLFHQGTVFLLKYKSGIDHVGKENRRHD